MPDAADIFEYYAGWTDKFYGETCPVERGFLNYTLRKPLGVCALIVPWNFPLLLATWKLAPALAMGNSVILKPAPPTSLTAIRLFELFDQKLDLPKGVLSLLLGGAPCGEALGMHSGVDKVSFTGSTEVGKQILQSSGKSNLKRVTLELGGKSPDIIFDDVKDLGACLERTFQVMFSQKGEKCSEPTRLFVQRSLYNEALEVLAGKAEKVRCGDAFDPSADQGSQCTEEQFDKIMHYIELGKKEGARLIAGGTRDSSDANSQGWFVRPTIFADVDNRSSIAQDEIFGPVLSVMPFDTDEEVVALANDTRYGLAAGLWTSDVSRAHSVAQRLDAGMVFVNRYGCYHFSSPFGGFKESGWGKEMGIHSLESYTKLQSIWVQI
jgi:aldehyde dehydrogenase (NAD+)